jgi:hypothetical protein
VVKSAGPRIQREYPRWNRPVAKTPDVAPGAFPGPGAIGLAWACAPIQHGPRLLTRAQKRAALLAKVGTRANGRLIARRAVERDAEETDEFMDSLR